MNLADELESLRIKKEESEKWKKRMARIDEKLSEKYYDNEKALSSHIKIVGSVGRKTAIAGTSDYDVLYILPSDIQKRFSRHEGNGQSALLQEVKKQIIKTYDKTDVRGDGQVVSIEFNDGVIELVPAFEKEDGSFEYPDSNNGGHWKVTNPSPEIDTALKADEKSSGVYGGLCRLLRNWKNSSGFTFKGLLIDTLVHVFLKNRHWRDKILSWELVEGLFEFLASENQSKEYWRALGSKQHIYDDGTFIKKAKKVVARIAKAKDKNDTLARIVGLVNCCERAPKEEFAYERFPNIDIKYDMHLSCSVAADNFRPMNLAEYLTRGIKLGKNKKLTFKSHVCGIPSGVKLKFYWKVRNVGEKAKGRERGNIEKGQKTHKENTLFSGPHYVECYAVLGDTVVARGHISVPIDTLHGY